MNYKRKHRWWVVGDNNGAGATRSFATRLAGNNGAGATRFLATTFGPRMDRNIFEKHGNDGSIRVRTPHTVNMFRFFFLWHLGLYMCVRFYMYPTCFLYFVHVYTQLYVEFYYAIVS